MFLHVFVTFLLFLCIFMHLCVCALCVAFVPCVAPCMVHGIGMHVMHHIIIMCSSSCSSCSSLIIIDHHHVRCSLIIDQSLNIDCCSLIMIVRWCVNVNSVRVDEWVSGWCPSSSVCGMAVVCATAVLPGAVVWPVPCSSDCSAGEYCCRVVHCPLPGAAVWVVGCVSVLFVWWGILCPFPPRRGGWWGHCRRVGGIADGGWHGE